MIEADADMVEKILLNLLSNATKFTFEGTITLRVRVGEQVELEVADTGVGIPEDELPRLFERFHRIHGARARSHEGSGIGLALVQELVELHGGEVAVTSAAGQGSTFRITLPARQPGAHAAAGTDPAAAEAQRGGFGQEALQWMEGERIVAAAPAADRPEVLVVDDNADLRLYLTRLLEDEYAVRTATDGEDALAQIAERPPDLVLTDVMMPGVDGFELLARLREDPRTQRLPVIMLSARAGEEATVEGLDAGADDYLVKPFSGPELLARVHANLEVTRLRNALATGERARAREMEDVALTLQRSLLPRDLPDVLGTELCGRYVPASESLEIGGDFYDATALGDGRLVLTIGDVAGHGVLAAAVMGQVRQAVRAYAFEGHPPAALMDRLDLLVSDSGLAMTTCLCGIFDPAMGVLRFANAGHPPPLLRRADGTIERVTDGLSHPLGVTMAHRHVEAELTLGLGDALLLYTDGLVERRGEVIDIGIDRLADRLASGFTSAEEACERIVAELAQNLSDDVAILAVTRTAMAGEQLHTVVRAHPDRLSEVRRRLAAWLTAHGATREEANDIVLATHEAAMNAIEHAYGPGDAEISVSAALRDGLRRDRDPRLGPLAGVAQPAPRPRSLDNVLAHGRRRHRFGPRGLHRAPAPAPRRPRIRVSDDELATLRVRERGDIVIADVEGEIDLSNASSLLMDLAASVPNTARGLVVDLSGLEFLDSSGVHMLYDIADRLATRQQRFAVVIPPDAPPRRAIELSGVEPAAWLHADQPSALAALA